jgi:hypothetical protein
VTALEQAVDRLERAVARLAAALLDRRHQPPAADDAPRAERVAGIAARVDAALARIGEVIGDEG